MNTPKLYVGIIGRQDSGLTAKLLSRIVGPPSLCERRVCTDGIERDVSPVSLDAVAKAFNEATGKSPMLRLYFEKGDGKIHPFVLVAQGSETQFAAAGALDEPSYRITKNAIFVLKPSREPPAPDPGAFPMNARDPAFQRHKERKVKGKNGAFKRM